MGEPEDLIIDGAYIASRLAREAWRRYSPPRPANVLRLADVRFRLELILNGLLEAPIVVAAAEPPAPVSWLARLAGHARVSSRHVSAGTDGTRIYLPATWDASAGIEPTFQRYLLVALAQAMRLDRRSTTIALGVSDDEVRDRFFIADARGVDAWIVREAPGLVPALHSARLEALAHRPPTWPRNERARSAEERLRAFLACDPVMPFADVPACPTAMDALAWAESRSPAGQSSTPYRALPAVYYWGCPKAPAQTSASSGDAADQDNHQRPANRRVAEMRRRPRIRQADEDEEDSGTGTWVIRTDEPQESVEDPFGLQRPADRADEADPEGLGDSLSELPEARVVRTPGRAKEILRAGDDLPRTLAATVVTARPRGVAYPEWDFRSGMYRRPGAIVRDGAAPLGDPAWVSSALARHAHLVRRVRTRFERLRPRRIRVGRQPDGPELDIAEYVEAAADARAGVPVEDRLYVDVRPGRRELTLALLVDVSASTDSWVSGTQRVVDVEKEALLVVCEALAALGDQYAIFAFSGEGPECVSVITIKAFAERAGEQVRRRVAALDADGYTRVGAAVRHATAALSRQPRGRRLLLLLSDGKPNDVDVYEGAYGVEDTRQAVAEARAQNVDVFCLTVDRDAPRYAGRIFGRAGFAVLRRPDQLPAVLIDVLRRLMRL
jgi:nitric oxide reductase NorD protein